MHVRDNRLSGEDLMNEAGTGAYVLRPGEGRSIDLGGFRMSVKATSGETAGSFSLLEANEPAGFGPPLHIHHDAAEAFYVLEGEYTIFIEAREFPCPSGSFIFIPAGIPHGFRVGALTSRKLNLYAPARWSGTSMSSLRPRGRATSIQRPYPKSRCATRWTSSGRSPRGTHSPRVLTDPRHGRSGRRDSMSPMLKQSA